MSHCIPQGHLSDVSGSCSSQILPHHEAACKSQCCLRSKHSVRKQVQTKNAQKHLSAALQVQPVIWSSDEQSVGNGTPRGTPRLFRSATGSLHKSNYTSHFLASKPIKVHRQECDALVCVVWRPKPRRLAVN